MKDDAKLLNVINPRISVIMSVFNAEETVHEAIESILAQTFHNFEFIIIDDCSTDLTSKILFDYSKKDERIKLIRNETNLGLTKSLNIGLELAKGDFIARIDADDISHPKRLEMQINILIERPHCNFVFSRFYYINDNQKKTYGPKYQIPCLSFYLLHFRNLFVHSTVMFRNHMKYLYDEACCYAQDYNMWLKYFTKDNFFVINDELVSFRIHPISISNQKKKEQIKFRKLIGLNAVTRILPGVNKREIIRLTRYGLNREFNWRVFYYEVKFLRGFVKYHKYTFTEKFYLLIFFTKKNVKAFINSKITWGRNGR